MAKPRVLVLAGYGINCDDETAFAFRMAGADADIVHINDLIENRSMIDRYQVFSFPGGFSYGDDTGSGKALANRIKNNLMDELRRFIERDTLMLGICNGFQVMINIGIIPAIRGFTGEAEAALEHNRTFRYQCRWVDLAVENKSPSVFTRGIRLLHIPVAHGEGNFFAPGEDLSLIEKSGLVTMRYVKPGGAPARGEFPYNPNGSMNDVASVCDRTGRIMGMMPHPERGMFFTQRDDWTCIKERLVREGKDIPERADGFTIFTNAVKYFG
ncbi:MAG: phosphoribosylformylglycinamidine synthase subunit PurQ [Spirochaetes bacterium]|nr:phosphoribosylformylglycinamidine synthase subunit PurQ [Spirochaetota bacterium]